MSYIKKYAEYSEELNQERALNERRNVSKKTRDLRVPMTDSTIRRLLLKTQYVQGHSLYQYNVLSFLISKRI